MNTEHVTESNEILDAIKDQIAENCDSEAVSADAPVSQDALLYIRF